MDVFAAARTRAARSWESVEASASDGRHTPRTRAVPLGLSDGPSAAWSTGVSTWETAAQRAAAPISARHVVAARGTHMPSAMSASAEACARSGPFGGAFSGSVGPGFDSHGAHSTSAGASSSRTSRSGADGASGTHPAALAGAGWLAAAGHAHSCAPGADISMWPLAVDAGQAELRAERAETELVRVRRDLAESQQRHRDVNQLLKRLGDANAALREEIEHARSCAGNACGASEPSVAQRLELELERQRLEAAQLRSRCGELERAAASIRPAASNAWVAASTGEANADGLLQTEVQRLRHRVWTLEGELQESKRRAVAAAAISVSNAPSGLAASRGEIPPATASPSHAANLVDELDSARAFGRREPRAEEARAAERRSQAGEQRCSVLVEELASAGAELESARHEARAAGQQSAALVEDLEIASKQAQALAQRTACLTEEIQNAQAFAQDSSQAAAGREVRLVAEVETASAKVQAAHDRLDAFHRQEATFEQRCHAQAEAAELERSRAEACARQWRGACSGCEDELRSIQAELAASRVAGRVAAAEELSAAAEHAAESLLAASDRASLTAVGLQGAVEAARRGEAAAEAESRATADRVEVEVRALAERAERADAMVTQMGARESAFQVEMQVFEAHLERQERTQHLELAGTTAAADAWRRRCDTERVHFDSREHELEEKIAIAVHDASERTEALAAARVEIDRWHLRIKMVEEERKDLADSFEVVERTCEARASATEAQMAEFQRQEAATARTLVAAERRCRAAEQVEADGVARGEVFQEVMSSVDALQKQNRGLREECQALYAKVSELLGAPALVGESLERAQRRGCAAETAAGSLREELALARAKLFAGAPEAATTTTACCGPPPARPPRKSTGTWSQPPEAKSPPTVAKSLAPVAESVVDRERPEMQAFRREVRDARGGSPLGDVTNAWQNMQVQAEEAAADGRVSRSPCDFCAPHSPAVLGSIKTSPGILGKLFGSGSSSLVLSPGCGCGEARRCGEADQSSPQSGSSSLVLSAWRGEAQDGDAESRDYVLSASSGSETDDAGAGSWVSSSVPCPASVSHAISD